MPSNLTVLTQSHKIVAAKKRQRREQIKEIVFDDDARQYVVIFALPRSTSVGSI